MQRFWAWAEQGNKDVDISGTAGSGSEVFQQSFPLATITVYEAGTVTPSTIYSDNVSTALANPFTAQSNAYFWFYAANGRYDVKIAGGGLLAPITLSDILLFESGALLTAISSLGADGIITRTSSTTAAPRTVTAGSGNITVTNGNGVSGNPTVDLTATLTGITISGSVNTLTVLAGSQLSGQVPLTNGGTGANLADPGADRVLFWDDSAGAVTWLTVSTGLSITATTLTCTVTGTVTGTGTTNALSKWTSATAIGDSGITDDATTIKLARNTRITSGSLAINGDFAPQAQAHIKSTASLLALEETDAGADEKVWLIDATSGLLALKTLTDAYGAGASLFTADRTGTAINYLAMATRFETKQGANVSSANDLTLGTDGNVFLITGSTQVNAVTIANWQAGSEITLIFNAGITIKHNTAGGAGTAVMLLSGAVDMVAAANDALTLVYNGTAFLEKCRNVANPAGTGTVNALAKFTATAVIGDSGVTDDATTIKLARNTRITTGSFAVNGDFAPQAQIHVKSTANLEAWEETDAGSDEKVWLWDAASGLLSLKTLSDAYGAGATVFSIDRTGSAVNYIAIATRLQEKQGADIASANDLTLGTDGNTFEITGATQVNAITIASWQNGSSVTLLFTSTPTVKHNTAGGAGTAVLLLAGAADFVASAGDTLTLKLSEIGGTQAWREVGRAVI